MTTKFYLMFKYFMYIILTIIIGCTQEPMCNPLSSVVAEYEYTYNGEPREGLCLGTASIVNNTTENYELEGTCSHDSYEASFIIDLHSVDTYYEGYGTLSMYGYEIDLIAWAFKQEDGTFLTVKLEGSMDAYDIYVNGYIVVLI